MLCRGRTRRCPPEERGAESEWRGPIGGSEDLIIPLHKRISASETFVVGMDSARRTTGNFVTD